MNTARETLWDLINYTKIKCRIDDIMLLRAYAMSKYATGNGRTFASIREQFESEYPFISADAELNSIISDGIVTQFSRFSVYDFLMLVTPNLVGNRKRLMDVLNRASRDVIERISYVASIAELNLALKTDNLTLSQAEKQKYDYYQKLFNNEPHRIPKDFFEELYGAFTYVPLDTEYALRGDVPADKDLIDRSLRYFNSIGDDKEVVQEYLIDVYQNIRNFSRTYKKRHEFENWGPKEVKEFNRNLQNLYNLTALNVYRAFYCGTNCDQQLETTFIYDRFTSAVLGLSGNSKALIVDPSPEFVYRLLNDSRLISSTEYTMIFQSAKQVEFLATASVGEDPRLEIMNEGVVHFYTEGGYRKKAEEQKKAGNATEEYDLILHFGNHYDIAKQRKWIWKLLDGIEKPVSILSLMATNAAQNVWQPVGDVFTSNENRERKLTISSVDLIPQNIYGSNNQKRKILFTAEKNADRVYPAELNCYFLRTDKNDAEMMVRDIASPILVEQDQLENLQIGIRKYYLQITQAIKSTGTEKRKRPNRYAFTPEITIWYTITDKGGGNTPRVRAYICEEADEKKMKRTQHNPIPRGAEIRGTSKIVTQYSSDEVIEWLEEIYPYSKISKKNERNSDGSIVRENIRTVIGQKISERYAGKDITFKTFWYIYPELREKYGPAYESITTMAKADLGLLKLSELTLKNTAPLVSLIQPKEKLSRSWLGYLSRFIDEAVNMGHIKENPLEGELTEKERENSRDLTAEIRNAIGKRDFSMAENICIMQETINELEQGHYEYIGVMIRLLTGLDSNTICGLKYEDISVLNDYPDIRVFMITHEITNNGKRVKPFDKIEDYRSIPVPKIVAGYLEGMRIELVQKYGKTEGEIRKCYIQRNPDGLPKEDNGECCPPTILEKLSEDIIKRIGIEDIVISIPMENEGTKEINLMLYGGDIFRNNFRSLAISEAGIIEDELMYLLGNKPTVTFYRYYCDFNNDAAILAMAQKMRRIEAKLCGDRRLTAKRSMTGKIKRYRKNNEDTIGNDAYPRRFEYEILNCPDNLTIIAENKYGMEVEVLVAEIEEDE